MQAASQEADEQLLQLTSQLAASQRQLHELSSESAAVLSRLQMQAREEGAVLRVKLEQVQGEWKGHRGS